MFIFNIFFETLTCARFVVDTGPFKAASSSGTQGSLKTSKETYSSSVFFLYKIVRLLGTLRGYISRTFRALALGSDSINHQTKTVHEDPYPSGWWW